ncbi:uncharacterized protein LOC126656903 [Mercurialis annua]|uniref:uncharacterized protein LOC126656903 n=1 Tax=Mercurialis annua TaxID=3986 RepID=UPI00215F39FF|nr:uncharacterized protein LOC126656903 [Mercurialis annua]
MENQFIPIVNAPAAHQLRDIQRQVVVNNPSEARNYELKTIHLNMLPQFNGMTVDDPLAFIKEFYGVVETFPLNRLTEEELRKRCFPYCMKLSARTWLLNLPEGSFSMWEEVYNAFITKYYSPQKTLDLRGKIYNITQLDGEPFHEAWERFKMLLAQCPHGLTMSGQTLVETASGGNYGEKTAAEINQIYENVALNSQHRAIRGRRAAVHEVSSQHDIVSEVVELTKQGHIATSYNYTNEVQSEEANFVSYNQNRQPRNDPYSNTYNPGWRNHPNFSWRDGNNTKPQGPPGFQQNRAAPPPPQQEKKPSLEDMMAQFMANQDGHNKKMEQRMCQIENAHQSSIHNVERQLGQLAKKIAKREQGKFPSNTETNPKEGAMTISSRSGKEVDNSPKEKKKENHIVIEEEEAGKNMEEEITVEKSPPTVKAYVPLIPYPQRQRKRINELHFQNFLDIFKKIQINIPFAEALAQMPSYAKFLKEIVSNKNKLEEYSMVALTEECSAILQKKLPPKLNDSGSFSIPCTIGNVNVASCLCDLGASINLMPLSLVRKLGITEMKPTTVSLQLADRSVKRPLGIVEDLLVKVGKIYLPADFLVLDMNDDVDLSIILGRPFLATGRVLIDVQSGKLTFRAGEDIEEFNIIKSLKNSEFVDSCNSVDIIDKIVEEIFVKESYNEPL